MGKNRKIPVFRGECFFEQCFFEQVILGIKKRGFLLITITLALGQNAP
jgi:hypothetical protein